MVVTPRSMRCAVASIAVLGIGLSGLTQASAAQPPPVEVKAKKEFRYVTLITGDRVLMLDDETPAGVEPGPGRRHIVFNKVKVKDRAYVYPSDVQQQVASGRLDKRLFDVSGLIKAGYDDKSSKSIPVIVTYGRKARAAIPGTAVARQLPVVNGAALKVEKSQAAGFLRGTARSGSGIEKVWLDGKRKPSLDESVPQIGAPAAWQAGYTGKGVKVAVLDTGVDTTHPDLASQVAERKNFTTEEGLDLVGHGTHVASTIAGSGAASDGKYKGVAPDAKLYDGKVCVADGCPESAILAGMEWAATEVKAGVVNLSLGGTDTPEIDPLEEAVNRLTAQTGSLFVIAAGNEGDGEETVGSPGSADAALTVGAVDKQNQLAGFSSRGPRIGDGGVKPDVTAPGVGIVAARAKDAVIGSPVGERYLSLQGTSMATPHVAGAAALLAQQHPAWRAGELKNLLIASAKPAADQTSYQQGAGRIDVATGIKQTVVSETGNLSFGTALWPHDDDLPVTRTVTYRNFGDKPVTLELASSLEGPDGKQAPEGSLRLSADKVTVPANGTASVQATSNTKHGGPVGSYSGRLTATGDDVWVTSAIGVVKESERYTLTVKAIGPDGKPAAPTGMLYRAGDWDPAMFGNGQQELTFRLAKNEYILHNLQFVSDGTEAGRGNYYWVVQPSLQLDKDTTVVFDARGAKPVNVTVPDAQAAVVNAAVGYFRPEVTPYHDFAWSLESGGFGNLFTTQVGSDLPADKLTSFVTSQWAKRTGDSFDNSPFLYTQLDRVRSRMLTGLDRNVQKKDLAVVQQQFNRASDRQTARFVIGDAPDTTMLGYLTLPVYYDQPTETTVLVDAKAAIPWKTELYELSDADPTLAVSYVASELRDYRAGRTYRERFNAAAFGTAPQWAIRIGDHRDELLFVNHGLMDADGNRGATVADSAWSKLLHDGKVVAENDSWGRLTLSETPTEKTRYTYQTSQTRESIWGLSTRTDLSWTFTTQAGNGFDQLPMLGVGYRPAVDKNNLAPRTPISVLPVFLAGQGNYGPTPAPPLPSIKSVQVQVSGDDGATWETAKVSRTDNGKYNAVFATPKGAKAISLRTKVVDGDDNVTEQTTIKAYPLR